MLRSLKCTLCILHTQNAKRRWLNSLQLNGKNLFILVSFIQALTVSSTETPHNNSNDCTDCLLLSFFSPCHVELYKSKVNTVKVDFCGRQRTKERKTASCQPQQQQQDEIPNIARNRCFELLLLQILCRSRSCECKY